MDGDGNRIVSWTSAMSTYMIMHLAQVVQNGGRTSSGFKSVHYNACARALNEHFRLHLNGAQISNHFRTIRKKFAKIEHIKNVVSGALWDEDQCMIRMDHELAVDYIKKHKSEAEFINRPIEHFKEMQILYGNRLATGKFAKGSGESLGTEGSVAETEAEDEEEGGETAVSNTNNAAESSATKPSKRAKTTGGEEDGLIATLGRVGTEPANAITAAGEKSAPKQDDDIPEDLYPTLMSFPRFNEAHAAHYFAYLVENPKIAKVFMKMSLYPS